MIGAVCSGFHRAVDVPCCNTPDHAVSTTDSWQRTITAGSEEATPTALSKIESNVAPGLAAADQQIAIRRRFDWVWPKGWSGWLAGKAVHRFEDDWRAERQIRGVFDDGPGNQTSLAVMTNAGAARDLHETPVVGLGEDVEHRTALLGIVIEDAMQVVGREGVTVQGPGAPGV